MSMPSNLRKAMAFGAFASILLSTSSAFSACYTGRAALSPQTVAEFKANPAALLQGGANDTARVISRIRDLVSSDPSTLPAIMNLLGGAGTAQQTAIGAGLGQAAQICTRNDPDFARSIQQAVAGSNVPAAVTAFAGASGDRSTAAGGAGGGGGGGVGGSVGGGAPGGGGGGGGTTGAGSPGSGTSSPTLSSGGNTGGGTSSLSGQSASP